MTIGMASPTWAASPAKKPPPVFTLHSPSGHLYRAGEFCPAKDLGKLDHGSDGVIKCVLDKGHDRWVKVV